jgi:hypothetical protein
MSAPGLETHATAPESEPIAGRAGVVLAIAGAVLAVGAGVALWASEGAGIFLESAVNAILTCF